MCKSLLFITGVVAVLSMGVLAMTVDDARALIPHDDVAIDYDEDGRAQLEAAIDAFRDALGVTPALDELNERAVTQFPVAPDLKDIVNKLSQCYYTLADVFLEEGSRAARDVYLKGKHWGLKSLRMDPEFVARERDFAAAAATVDDVPALFWASANWLRAAEFDPLGAALGGVPAKAEALLLRILELDPSYVSYGVYRSLGALWAGLPSLPLVHYSQNLPRAGEYLCHVVDEPDLCPHGPVDPAVEEYLENRFMFVEHYLVKVDKLDDARRVLTSILEAPIEDTYPLYNAVVQERAAALLQEIEER